MYAIPLPEFWFPSNWKIEPDQFIDEEPEGQGPRLEDVLFAYPVTGHYRYLPSQYEHSLQAGQP